MPRKRKNAQSPVNPKAADTDRPKPAEEGMSSAQVPRLKILGLNTPESRTSVASNGVIRERHVPPPEEGLRDPYFSRKVRLLDFLLFIFLAVGAFCSVALTYRGIGHSWDEALYLRPAASAGQWIIDLVRGDKNMLTPAAIDNAWGRRVTGEDPLHPEVAPIPKAVIGLGISFLSGYGVPEMLAMRLPIALVFGLTIGWLYLLGCKTYGRLPGFVGAVSYWLMPRVFGHAHIAASETLFAFMLVLLAWTFLNGIKRPWAAALTGVAFALAFNTKVTALFLPPALLIWGQLYYRRDYASNVFAIALGSPVIIFALWPWLWYDPLVRLAEYIKFYAAHQKTAVFYMGRMWGYIYGPPAPWHYPLVITGVAVPLWSLLLMVVGIVSTVVLARRRPVPMFYLLLSFTLIGICSLPNAPKYDGERLFFGAFAFLALLAAGGFCAVDTILRHWAENNKAVGRWGRPFYLVAVLTAMGYNVRTLAVVHPDELNFFNALIGGARDAYEKGFETAYWGEAVNEDVIDYLNSLSKPGTKFKPLALNELAFINLQGWGMLSNDGVYVAASEPYDYYILQVRQGFFGNRERALHFGAKPLRVFEGQGVPKIEVFAGDALTTMARLQRRQTDDLRTTASGASARLSQAEYFTTPNLNNNLTTVVMRNSAPQQS
ncbi:MAG: glycosyltransferase family 39 protein, partial [Candidatus Sumerlaeaceae bacterium]|nr:glycosyltransferase family 39 protein [Candidatus Sumerlaeaceae bacterium]